MKVCVLSESKWEFCGQFPTFSKGTSVKIIGAEDDEFAHWFPCEIEGFQTFVPNTFLRDEKLIREYNPTELIVDIGEILEVVEIVNAWLIVRNRKGAPGWIPAERVVSVGEF